MRSIRRSLLGYLLLLLAVALGAVGLLVDRFANGAIRQREASETDRIQQAFKLRQRETRAKFDADLMAETKAKAREVLRAAPSVLGQNLRTGGGGPGGGGAGGAPRPPVPEPQQPVKASEEEGKEYLLRTTMTQFAQFTNPAGLMPATVASFSLQSRFDVGPQSRRYNPFPAWVEFDGPRTVARIGEALSKAFDDDDNASYYQFTLVGTYQGRANRTFAVAHSSRLGADLPLDPEWLEPNRDLEPQFSNVDVPGKGQFRQVVTGTGVNGRPLLLPVLLPSPPPPAPVPPKYPLPYPHPFPGSRGTDVWVRVFVHHARPHAELDARLAADQTECDDQLSRVGGETRMELAELRWRLILIGAGTFAALVLGGWFFVARGLAPLRKLSDAVSRVSERDFRLPVEAAELGRELAPIHARLTQTLTLLQRAFEREKQAVADISHELRTPIASLLATIDVSLRKPRTPEQYRTTLEECRLISRQLGQLVERIMTLASLDAGNDRTLVGAIDMADLIGGCAAVIRPLAAANNLTLSVRLDEELALESDAGKLREVLMNLLHNAVEYNTPGGTIQLTARRDGEFAVFEVRDTGIGIPDDVREKIFERFYRADASRHATGVHAGLGLAIVREYVARLNGTIAVESAPGAGTTFRVTLPATSDSPPAPPPSDRVKSRDTAVPTGS